MKHLNTTATGPKPKTNVERDPNVCEVIALVSDDEDDSPPGGTKHHDSDDDDNNSSRSSTLSSSHRSLDDEDELNADEADEEDENENEERRRAQNKPKSNENLLHVQNFLNSFNVRVNEATNVPGKSSSEVARREPGGSDFNVNFNNKSNIGAIANDVVTAGKCGFSELRSWRNKLKDPAVLTVPAASTSASSSSKDHFSAPVTATTKPPKFNISTKFLRKRNKLKASPSVATKATTARSGELQKPKETSGAALSSTRQRPLDDPIAKFKDFSIDSLLHK